MSLAAKAARISDRTARKRIARAEAEGPAGLAERSSAPVVVANRTAERHVEMNAETLLMPLSTVSGIWTRIGTGKLCRLGMEPGQRYERARARELIHTDVRKLGRIASRASLLLSGGPRDQGLSPPIDDAGLGVRARRH